MTLKTLQWVLFLLVAIGTPAVVFGFELRGERGLLAFLAGISSSLYVFCFVPYLSKYYMSELIAITISFGLAMTLFANAFSTVDSAGGEWLFIPILAGFILPFITYWIIERGRPSSERIGFAVQPQDVPDVTLRSAKWDIGLGVFCFSIYAIWQIACGPNFRILINNLWALLSIYHTIKSTRTYLKIKHLQETKNPTEAN